MPQHRYRERRIVRLVPPVELG